MSKQIQVFLLEDVPTVGKAGDIASVSEGYARNFLFPHSKAVLASADVRSSKAKQDDRKKHEQQVALKEVQRIAEILEGKELKMNARIKDGNQIFGSIAAQRIAEELNRQANLKLKAKSIELKEPITAV